MIEMFFALIVSCIQLPDGSQQCGSVNSIQYFETESECLEDVVNNGLDFSLQRYPGSVPIIVECIPHNVEAGEPA